nr:BamA/TamA family outer membrane protein [uncultured Carboxylicivirga sp.]
MKEITRLLLLIGAIILSQVATGQEKDTISVEKNVQFSILGGPGYTPDFGVVIGGSALVTLSTNPQDTLLKRSVLPFAFAYMTNGGGTVMLRPQLFFNQDRFRIFGTTIYKNVLENYYGIGYDNNSSIERGEETTQYRMESFRFNPTFLLRYKKTNIFIGGSLDLMHSKMKDASEGVLNDANYIAQGGDENGLKNTNVGFGINFNYDTRDLPANSYSGVFFEFSTTNYFKALGSTSNFGVYNFDYRQFLELKFLGDRRVLAWNVNGRFTSGDVPINDMSMVGSPFDLRGYYLGHYRDRNAMYALAEYRHMFNLGDETKMRKLLSRFGFATWGGIGSVSDKFVDVNNLLPNFGAGLRIEVQPRMNFRVDVGRDPLNNQTLFYFNMTEAF